MATIRDVAKKAGVAPMTVSRVLNNSGYVSPETRSRVEAAKNQGLVRKYFAIAAGNQSGAERLWRVHLDHVGNGQ